MVSQAMPSKGKIIYNLKTQPWGKPLLIPLRDLEKMPPSAREKCKNVSNLLDNLTLQLNLVGSYQ